MEGEEHFGIGDVPNLQYNSSPKDDGDGELEELDEDKGSDSDDDKEGNKSYGIPDADEYGDSHNSNSPHVEYPEGVPIINTHLDHPLYFPPNSPPANDKEKGISYAHCCFPCHTNFGQAGNVISMTLKSISGHPGSSLLVIEQSPALSCPICII